MDRKELYNVYYDKDFKTFLKEFDKYLENGYGIEDTLIGCYIHALIATKKFDKAYKILKALEKNVKEYETYEDLARLYVKCFKPKDAERLINSMETPVKDYLTLIKIKLLEGKIKEAQEILNVCLKNETDPSHQKRLRSYEKLIINHFEKGAYIETTYESFKERGNKLEPGHIVFLKNYPKSEIRWQDTKVIDRPYMIWKIEEDKIYIFPVSTKDRKKAYKLFTQKYPNSLCDRIIKYSLYNIAEEDIISVQDKVLDEDFKIIIENLYQAAYFSTKESKRQNRYFMQEFIGPVLKYDVIMDLTSSNYKKMRYYLILDVEEDHYRVIEIDDDNKKIIGFKSEKYKKSRVIYDLMRLTQEEIDNYISQLSEQLKIKSLVGKKVTANDIKYIVVDEDKENYLCIDEIYSLSYINVEAVNKNDIKTVHGEVSKEELGHIKELLSEHGYNIKKYLKRLRKK